MSPYRNLEEYNLEITDEVKSRYSSIIDEIGEDVSREGLVKTPERAAKAMLFLTQGYQQDAVEILKGAMFKAESWPRGVMQCSLTCCNTVENSKSSNVFLWMLIMLNCNVF